MIQISRRMLLAMAGAGLVRGQEAAGDARNVAPPGTRTVYPLKSWADRAAWEQHAAHLRRRLLLANGLWPVPEKTMLMTRPHGRVNHGDFITECVLIETWPGLWIAANVYLPAKRQGRVPGVLVAHGHWKNGRLENTDECSTPLLCANLAAQGYLAVAYDMVGYNESDQLPHRFGTTPEEQAWHYGPLGIQTWNSIRMLDFLVSRDEVDRERIGMTGASGGGTQTFLLAALDERVKAVAPVNMISAHFQGGCDCENGPGLRWGTNNVETGSMAAPRPQLLVAATGDWTRDVPRIEYPAIRKVYELYDAGDRITTWQQTAGHNYNQASREAVYRFFHGLWGDKERPAPVESVGAPPIDSLRARKEERPAEALSAAAFFEQWKARCRAATKGLGIEDKRARLAALMGMDASLGPVRLEDGSLRTDAGWRIPAEVLKEGGKGGVLMLRTGDGAPVAGPGATATVLSIQLFQTGAASTARPRDAQHFLTFNASDEVCRVQDVLAGVAWLRTKVGVGLVDVVAGDAVSQWAALVAQAVAGPGVIRLRGARGVPQAGPVPGLEFAGGMEVVRELGAR